MPERISIWVVLKGFLIAFMIWMLAGGILMCITTKELLFLKINGFYADWADPFFQYVTFIGDGFTPIILSIILLLLRRFRPALMIFSGYALSGLIVQGLKKMVFTEAKRPWMALKDVYPLHIPEGFIPYTNNSFPSGHTATAFCMFLLLPLIFPVLRKHSASMMVAPMIVGWSRIYLAQHYFSDVYGGSVIGVLSGISVYLIMERFPQKRDNLPVWDEIR